MKCHNLHEEKLVYAEKIEHIRKQFDESLGSGSKYYQKFKIFINYRESDEIDIPPVNHGQKH